MSRLRFAITALLLPGLAQCGVLPPFETQQPPLTKAETDVPGGPPPRVSVCYNALTASAAQVLAVATAGCDPGTTPHAQERDYNLMNCPLLQPARATFVCLKNAEPKTTTGER